jgi:hypothetical protein
MSKDKAVAYSMPHILSAGIWKNVEILSRETATGRALNPELKHSKKATHPTATFAVWFYGTTNPHVNKMSYHKINSETEKIKFVLQTENCWGH